MDEHIDICKECRRSSKSRDRDTRLRPLSAPSDSIPPSVPAELAAPEDVASMLNHLRLSKFSIDRCIADVLEATVRENGNLATRNRALEGAIEEHNKRLQRWNDMAKNAGSHERLPPSCYMIKVPK